MRRILIVEDVYDNRRIMSDALSRAGYEVLEASRGPEGVQMACDCLPDLILMDIQLPEIDGYEATRQIRGHLSCAHIPVIAVTSYALPGDKEKALAAGCQGYLAKPFRPRELVDAVKQLID